MTRLLSVCFTLLALLAATLGAQDRGLASLGNNGKRVALVVGNDTYQSVPSLSNAVRDAEAIQKALVDAGFQVTLLRNANREALETGVNTFIQRIQPGDVALFYYSGHGFQIDGQNYLAAVDLQAANAVQARLRSLSALEVVAQMEARGADLQIVVLDACRDNPFAAQRTVGVNGGLAAMTAGKGTFLAYSTAPGQTADDNRSGTNGLYTGFLVQALSQQGLPLEQVFKQAGAAVDRASGGKQVPWVSSSMRGDFFFHAPAISGNTPIPRTQSFDAASEAWALIRDSKNPVDFDRFQARFPNSDLAGVAEIRASQLRETAAPTPATPKPAHVDTDALVRQGNAARDAKDYSKALTLYRQAADLGNSEAIKELGNAYFYGRGVTQDYAEALRWYHKAADLGNAAAMHSIGFAYTLGVTPDYAEALRWYRKSAELGNSSAMNNIGALYERGEGVKQDYAEALRWYRKAADLGSDGAMSNVGSLYANGQGATQDYPEALRWYRKAADLGNSDAMSNIGVAYAQGQGVKLDYAEAVRWSRKAADLGNNVAMSNIGYAYFSGQGVTQDYAEALRWYHKAADLGNSDAMYNIGFAYSNGQGVVQDYAESLRWYRKAADVGNRNAMNNIGYAYGEGRGVTQDYAEALRWYHKAADLGNPDAMLNIGDSHENGRGVHKDRDEAINWYRKAAAAGLDSAKNDLKRLGVSQ